MARGLLLCGWLLAVPVWAAPGAKSLPADARATGEQFADSLLEIAGLLSREYVKPIPTKALCAVGMKALYALAREPLPDQWLRDLDAIRDPQELRRLLIEARAAVHGKPQLEQRRDLLAAVGAFTSILDPASTLVPSAVLNGTATANRFGFEFEGEATASVPVLRRGRVVEEGEPLPANKGIVPSVPFRVLFVRPGSPAQKAGLRPGDLVTHINDHKADALTGDKAYAALHADGERYRLTIERVGVAKPLRFSITAEEFVQESLFGVKRKGNNEWDYWLDQEAGLAYIRLGAIEHDSGELLSTILHDLRDIKGLLFDLRWCPGGYIDAATQIASTFLEKGVIAKMTYRNPSRGEAKEIHADGGLVRFKAGDYPIIVLVNGETIGGGELVAAALKDNDRALLAGTRTFGKATIQWPETMRQLPGYSFKITGGTYARPNGKNLQRFPESKPTDDWGLLPDPGYTIPTSADLAKKLKEMHTLYALRPGGSKEALELDDPDTDPQRVRAVKLLRTLVQQRKE